MLFFFLYIFIYLFTALDILSSIYLFTDLKFANLFTKFKPRLTCGHTYTQKRLRKEIQTKKKKKLEWSNEGGWL